MDPPKNNVMCTVKRNHKNEKRNNTDLTDKMGQNGSYPVTAFIRS